MQLPNNKLIVTALMASMREHIGEYLSTVTIAGVPTPAIILERTKGIRPDFPYIFIERIAPDSRNGSWRRDELTQYDEDLDKWYVTNVSEQTITYKITCLGEASDDILTLLRLSYMDDLNRINLNKELDGAIFQQFSDVEETPVFLETDFVEGAVTSITFTNVVELRAKESSVIETITGTGDLGYLL